MKKNKQLLFLAIGLSSFFCQDTLAFLNIYRCPLPPKQIANLLGWMPTASNICGGYYKEPEIILSCAAVPELDAATTTITADNTVFFSAQGTSQLEGNIVVTQPGRKMTADKAVLYRDCNTHEINQILLSGNVHYYEAGKHLVAQTVFIDFQKKIAKLGDVLYRLAKKTPRETLNAWGQAKSVERRSNNCLILNQASYTTCPPISQTWKILATKLRIDRETGWGEAVNTYLLIHDLPILWVPYFSFPVDKKRKTGFLFPTIGYATGDGLHVKFPYYLNLAPNYDATLIPGYIYRRGLEFQTHFRYLTCHHTGNLNIEFLPYDKQFAHFRHTAEEVYGVDPNTLRFLRRLENNSNSRAFISFCDNSHFNPHWWGSLNLNYVTDDYYLQDFMYSPYYSTTDQLLNQAILNYASDNWRFLGRIQTYQSLHPINQQPILDQYSRLPQLFITSDYPEFPNQFNFNINSELVYFDHPRDFFTQIPATRGQRLHLEPSISFPFITPYSFFTPRLQIDTTYYNLQDHRPSQITRILPVFDIDTGIYLERQFGHFTQTLEPRFFYLFVPYQNQNDIPIFDTTLPPFNFSQLFRTNRFVGYDKLGDANQLSISLTSRLLDSCTGYQKLRASIGQVIYFKRPEVCLTPDCNNDFYVNHSLSPIVGEINYNFNCAWDGVLDVAVSSDDYSLNNASMQFHYKPDCKHIFNLGYDFVRKGDTLTTYKLNSSKNNLNRINLALAWQLTDHWQALANLNYNLSHGHPQAYFYGFQYDSCCWAVRIVASRIVTAENVNSLVKYQTNFYVQLQLKGLGNLGNSNPGNLLTSSIFGYKDNFKG